MSLHISNFARLTKLASSLGSSLIGYLSDRSWGVATTVQDKMRADEKTTIVGDLEPAHDMASYIASQDISTHAWYAFLDESILDYTGNVEAVVGHAGFNDNVTIQGSKAFDHHHSFQSYPHFNCSGQLRELTSYWSMPDIQSGVVSEVYGLYAATPSGAGSVNHCYGVYVEELTKGNLNSYAIRTMGATKSLFGGQVKTETGFAAFKDGSDTPGVGSYAAVGNDAEDRIWYMQLGLDNSLDFHTYNGTDWTKPVAITGTTLHVAQKLLVGTSAFELTDVQSAEFKGLGGITTIATGSSGNACVLNWHKAVSGDNLFSAFYTEVSPTARGSIDYNRAGGVVRYNTTSDATLKNLIGDAHQEKSLSILNSTRLREYSWKDDKTGKVQVGVIAQELYETFSGAVSVGGDYEEVVAEVTERRLIKAAVEAVPAGALCDEWGVPYIAAIEAEKAEYETVVIAPEHTVTKYRPWGVDKTAFTWHLIAGYQAQQAQIASMQDRLAILEAKLT